MLTIYDCLLDFLSKSYAESVIELDSILVHVFWYKISSRCTDTSVSKALKGWSYRSYSSPPLKPPLSIISVLYSVDFRFTANPSDFLSQLLSHLLSHLLSQSEVRYDRLSRYSDGSIWQVKMLLVLHPKRPSKLLQVQKQI